MSFKERAELGMELLSKKPPFTYEEMLASVKSVRESHFPKKLKDESKAKDKLK